MNIKKTELDKLGNMLRDYETNHGSIAISHSESNNCAMYSCAGYCSGTCNNFCTSSCNGKCDGNSGFCWKSR